MYFQASEYQRTDTKEYGCHNPEIHRRIEIFPEPLMFKHSTSVPIHNIEKRIDLQYPLYNFRHRFNLPQNRGCPHANLYPILISCVRSLKNMTIAQVE